jgi:acyl-CoA synthetase (AMP-forming)/AMP-acid ligase II/aryl carrier-like protein
VQIGRPVANTRLEVLDDGLRRVPVGVAGQLCIGGVQLARGYLSRPGLTADRFVPDPIHKGQRLYRTGDVAAWRPDGSIAYLGRSDDQIKINGVRIELGEIEARLAEQPEIAAAAVAVHGGGQRLVAYLVLRGGESADWAARLRRHLPEFMVPSLFVPMDALPRTPSGKLDRRALVAPQQPDTGDRDLDDAVERVIAQIWCEVLGLSTVGADANFFAVGGDSIRSLRVAARLREAGYPVQVQQLFAHSTLRDLARVLRARGKGDDADE